MMNFIATIILILGLSVSVFAETYKYIVYVDKFPSVSDKVILKESGYKNRQQPSENTQYIVSKNTDVVVLEVTFKDKTEKSAYAKLEKEGKIFLYEISGTVVENGSVEMKRFFTAPIPIDLNKDWGKVGISTP